MARPMHPSRAGGKTMLLATVVLATATLPLGDHGAQKSLTGLSDSGPVVPVQVGFATHRDGSHGPRSSTIRHLGQADRTPDPLGSRPLATASLPLTLSVSLPDSSGRASAEWGPGPQVLYLGQDQTVNDYLLTVPVQATLCSVRSFLAWDAGSIGEAGFDLTVRGTRLAERSDHKEVAREYDGWQDVRPKTQSARYDLVAGDEIHIQTRASQTAPRTVDGGRSTRIEFAWRLTLSLTGRCE